MAYIVILEYKLTVSYKTEQLYHMIHQLSSWYLPKGVENLYTHTHTHTHTNCRRMFTAALFIIAKT